VEKADEDHYFTIADKLAGGRLIPFLGAGANLCDRGEEVWAQGGPFLPSGYELAGHLANKGRYPLRDDLDLLRVSQYVGAARGEDELYLILREVFDAEYAPTSLHRLVARAAKYLNAAGLPQLIVVTTNYDDLVERAFAEDGLEYDVVWYEAKQGAPHRGRFVHRPPGGKPKVIAHPNRYTGLPIVLERPAVLKLHGCLDRESASDDSYVITEDSYIDYFSGGDVGKLIPIALSQRMTGNSLLFLGYSLRDWNLRVILNRLWGTRKLQVKSWAVQREPSDSNQSKVEEARWDQRENVELVFCELSEYVRELGAKLPAAAPAAPSS
jgi:SIR2-like domain